MKTRDIKFNRNKRIAKKKKDKKLYVWFLMGALCLLGIGVAILAFFRSKKKDEPVKDIAGFLLPEIETQEDGQEKEAGRQAEEENQKADSEKDQKEGRRKEQEAVQERQTKKAARAVGSILYLLLVLGICIVPLMLFWFWPAETTAENRTMAALPEVWTAEGFNWNVLSEAGAYFTDHFFLRQEMVSINAGIRSEVFGVSPVEDVIVGENGWLYYSATLDDYQHKNGISERALFNIAHNTALMQEYTEGLGKTFVFTIAPNKNSLYGENMPERMRYQVAQKSDAQRLLPWLVRENVNYVDLFALFGEQEEILYYARDSHWNEKGAVMVYHALLDASGKQHETYEGAQPQQQADYFGDLGVMLFPVGGIPEVRLQYPVGDTWRYVEGQEVEDPFIRTENEKGKGNLLMYRDSFGNSLLPYMAQTFSQGVFSRQVPYAMSDLVTYEPDILIVEKVERQLPTLGKVPPIMNAPIRETGKVFVAVENTAATVSLSKEGSYWKLEGLADSDWMDTDSRIYVEVDDGGGAKLYEAFCVSGTDTKDGSANDYGYILYVSETQAAGDTFYIRVLMEQEEAMIVLLEGKICALQDGLIDSEVKSDWEASEGADGEEAVKENSEETDRKEIDKDTEAEGDAEENEAVEDGKEGNALGEQTPKAGESTEENTKQNENKTPARDQKNAGKRSAKSQSTTDTQAVRDQKTEEVQTEAQSQTEAQAQTEAQDQTAAQQQGQQAVTEVSRIYMEDCGSDSGYWVITYSDGHVEYVDD